MQISRQTARRNLPAWTYRTRNASAHININHYSGTCTSAAFHGFMKIDENMCMYSYIHAKRDRKASKIYLCAKAREKWLLLYRLIRFSCVAGENDKAKGHRYNNAIIIRNAYMYRWRLCQSIMLWKKIAGSYTITNKTNVIMFWQ